VLAEDAMTARLLKAFGQTQNFGVSAYMETREQAAQRRSETSAVPEVQADRESGVGSVAGMNEASLRAYREAASACVELGRYDLLYSLLFLSVSHPYWLLPENRYKYGYVKASFPKPKLTDHSTDLKLSWAVAVIVAQALVNSELDYVRISKGFFPDSSGLVMTQTSECRLKCYPCGKV
jgi:hypothetical protein